MEEDKQSLSELEEEQLEVEDEGSDQDGGTKESEVAEEASEITDEKLEDSEVAEETSEITDEKLEDSEVGKGSGGTGEDTAQQVSLGDGETEESGTQEAIEPEVVPGDETSQVEEKPSDGAQDLAEAAGQSTEASAGGQEDLMEKMYEESFKRVEEGQVVQGRIVQIDKEFVLVDIGYKSEGQVRVAELTGPDGTIESQVGDTLDVMVERWDDDDGIVVLSKERHPRLRFGKISGRHMRRRMLSAES